MEPATKRRRVVPTIINKFALAPPDEGLLLNTRDMIQLARGCESVLDWGLAKTDRMAGMPDAPEWISAKIITKQHSPDPKHSQAQHDQEAADDNRIERVVWNDTRIQYETHGRTHTIGGRNRIAWPVVLALWRALGTKPYRQAIATCLVHASRHSRDSSFYRAFTMSPLAEPKILALILQF